MCKVKTQIAKIAHCKTTSVLRYSAIYAMHCNAILQNATGLVFSSASVEMGWASMAQPRWSPKLRFTLQFAPSLCMSPWFVLRYASVGYSLERNTRLLTDLTVWSWRMMHVQGKMQIPMVLSMLLYGFTNLGLWWAEGSTWVGTIVSKSSVAVRTAQNPHADQILNNFCMYLIYSHLVYLHIALTWICWIWTSLNLENLKLLNLIKSQSD